MANQLGYRALDSAGVPLDFGDTINAPIPRAIQQVYHTGERQIVILRGIIWRDNIPFVLFMFEGGLYYVPSCQVFKIEKRGD